jgi:heptose I phosphotransferase
MIYIRPEFESLFAGEQTVAGFFQIPYEVVRRFKNRSTGRFVRSGRTFYIKVHHPVGWWPVAQDLLQLRAPQIGARFEWLALTEIRDRGILAPHVVAFGEEGKTLASHRSFVITEDVSPAISLEALVAQPQTWPLSPSFKRRLIRALANTARSLHAMGINHRDFYLCHFLLDLSQGTASLDQDVPRLYLIDLHRAQRRSQTPRRWIVKDLAGLFFSAMDIDLNVRDLALFIRCYSGKSVPAALRENLPLWRAVRRRAKSLYCKVHKQSPRREITQLLAH